MTRTLNDILQGRRSSRVVTVPLGDDPDKSYRPKAKGEQDFVDLHKVEKHEDRTGNGDDVFNASNIKKAPHKRTPDKGGDVES